jgi:predicted lipoprotein with Yx(FWY)xxD motif
VRRAHLLVVAAVALVAITSASASTSTQAIVKTAFNKALKATILVDAKGHTLYLLTSDPKGTATCAALDPVCPSTWPALATTGAPKAGPGVKASLLGTTKGAHGVTQVTYNGHPLYTFHGGNGAGAGDKKPGDTRGQAFFSIWYVVSPKGSAIK